MNETKYLVGMSELPSLPVVIQKLNEIVEGDGAEVPELAKVIETDQGFTARVLKLVNSPFYGCSRKIVSVEEAITILGFNALHNLLLATSLLSVFQTDRGDMEISRFLRHSFGVGVIAKHLLVNGDKDTCNEALVCGILHDIGRLALAGQEPDLFSWFYFKRDMVTDLAEEVEHFGIDHQSLGEMLAVKWNFPESIKEAIGLHHSPLKAQKAPRLVAAVNIADLLCHALAIGQSGNRYISEFFPEAWELLELDIGRLEKILLAAVDEINESEEIFARLQ